MTKKIFLSLIISGSILLIASCGDRKDHPGYDFMPDMKYSVPYDYYSPNPNFKDSVTARPPVKGTVPRGHKPYPYENTNEGYERAGKELTNPLKPTVANLAEGQRLFNIYCAICHGSGGEGDGAIVTSGKFPPPPSYFTEQVIDLPEGKMYHSIMYGKNLMGSYASQVNEKQRWQILLFVKKLQEEYKTGTSGEGETDSAETTAADTTKTES